MSNRVLDRLIGNRFQQVVLGIYIGTIVYALFLLSTIRDIDSGVHIPALSIYLLIVLTVFDIFLFIYFLHYITQSIKYEVIIERIKVQTFASLKSICILDQLPTAPEDPGFKHVIHAKKSGIYETLDKQTLLKICKEQKCKIQILCSSGTFILKDLPLLKVNKDLPDEVVEDLLAAIILPKVESISENYLYGFRQLMEVAIKALSPGINDPGTAIVSLRALFQLMAYRSCHFPVTAFQLKNGEDVVFLNTPAFENIMEEHLLPIWEYGKRDRLFSVELSRLLKQFQVVAPNGMASRILVEVEKQLSLR